jgi:DNA polymerase-1
MSTPRPDVSSRRLDVGALLDWARALVPRAIAVHVRASERRDAPLEREDVAVCCGDEVVLVAVDDASALTEFGAWLAAPESPYVVLHRAQAFAHRWCASGLPLPRRLGCLTTAATLLAEGADGRRDERPLDLLWRELSGRDIEFEGLEQVATLLPLMKALTPAMRTSRLVPVFELEMQVLPAVIAMERDGMPVDRAALERVASEWVRERSADPPPEEPRLARLDKLISTYRFWGRDYVAADGRVRPTLNPLATDSGRFSCSEPNLQQVPNERTAPGMRACFRPEPGYRFVIADYAQIELRVAAQLAPCDALRGVFQRGGDPHRATASTLTGKSAEEITKHERQLAKAINFGFLFGMGARRFRGYARSSYGVELTEEESEGARAAFFRTYPGLAAWHRRVGALGRRGTDVTVTTALGRRKRFDAGAFSYSAALNIPVQGTAADGFKRAMVELHALLPELGARGVLVVHDEYIAEVPELHAEEACRSIASAMESAMSSVVPDVPIEVEAVVAESWSDKA